MLPSVREIRNQQNWEVAWLENRYFSLKSKRKFYAHTHKHTYSNAAPPAEGQLNSISSLWGCVIMRLHITHVRRTKNKAIIIVKKINRPFSTFFLALWVFAYLFRCLFPPDCGFSRTLERRAHAAMAQTRRPVGLASTSPRSHPWAGGSAAPAVPLCRAVGWTGCSSDRCRRMGYRRTR